jgi:hypothetical protein
MKRSIDIFLMYLIFFFSSCIILDLRDTPNSINETKEDVLFAAIITDVPGVQISLYPRNTAKDSGPFAFAATVFENDRLHTGKISFS